MFCAFEDDAHASQIVKSERRKPPRLYDAIGTHRADAGHAQQHLEGGSVDFDGEEVHVFQGPCAFRVIFLRQILSDGREFAGRKAVKTEQPICLIQPVFAQQSRTFVRQKGVSDDRHIGRVIYAFE